MKSEQRFFDGSGAFAPEVFRAAIDELQMELHRRKPKYVQVAIADPAVSCFAADHEKRVSVGDANALARWYLGKMKGIAELDGYSVDSQVWRSANGGWRQISSAVNKSLLFMLESALERESLTIIDSVASFVWNRLAPKIRSQKGAQIRLGTEYWMMQIWEGGSLPHITKSFWRSEGEDTETVVREFARSLLLSSGDEGASGLTVYVDNGAADVGPLMQTVYDLMERRVSVVPHSPRLQMREVVAPEDSAIGDVSWPR
ncbi:hypothetical protein [Thiohalomonas denitrificans]|uniref:hypothetical protein n=1 Tax=Thiohalomonas denitrificans TaxID=415747 RepID=UPI0026EE4567|nr:hypothetical protein [Thiohalomonas denitrificans]